MLGANMEQSSNNGVIVSQVTNLHAPQDFTVSRLLSTPTHSMGKNMKIFHFPLYQFKNYGHNYYKLGISIIKYNIC